MTNGLSQSVMAGGDDGIATVVTTAFGTGGCGGLESFGFAVTGASDGAVRETPSPMASSTLLSTGGVDDASGVATAASLVS
jgi:hypothetical protein